MVWAFQSSQLLPWFLVDGGLIHELLATTKNKFDDMTRQVLFTSPVRHLRSGLNFHGLMSYC